MTESEELQKVKYNYSKKKNPRSKSFSFFNQNFMMLFFIITDLHVYKATSLPHIPTVSCSSSDGIVH